MSMSGPGSRGRGTTLLFAAALVLSMAPPAAAGTTTPATALFLDGQAGSGSIWGEQQKTLEPPGYLFLHEWSTPHQIQFNVRTEAYTDWYGLRFAAPSGEDLAVGAYEGAVRTPVAGEPGLDIDGNGAGCNTVTGRFEVLDIAFDAEGGLDRFAVDFEHHCEGGPAATYGSLRYQSSVALKALLIQPLSISFGTEAVGAQSSTRQVVIENTGNDTLTIDASLSGTYPTDFRIVSDGCTEPVAPDGTCQIGVAFAPTAGGGRSARLLLDDDTFRGSHRVTLAGSGVVPASGTWSAADSVGPSYSWSLGGGLARTLSGSTEYLHVQMARDNIGGTWITDQGPYMGVYYVRYRAGTETAPFRVNPSTRHGARATIAAAGQNVYVVWTSLVKAQYDTYDPALPRTLYFRRNSNHGSSSDWSATVRLTSTSGRIDWPIVAASGASVYVAYTDSDTGNIRLAVSRDRGATWSTQTLGTTIKANEGGKVGVPVVSVSGNTIAVAWLANGSRAVRARISTDGGVTWATPRTLASSSFYTVAVHALGNRVAFSWTTTGGVLVQVWQAGSWKPVRTVTTFSSTGTFKAGYFPAVGLVGSTGIGVAWGECRIADCSANASGGVDLAWRESTDNGVTWKRKVTLGNSTTGSWRFLDFPSVVWANSSRRYLLYNATTATFSAYRVFIRSGDTASAAASVGMTPSPEPEDAPTGQAEPRSQGSFRQDSRPAQ